jgi:hypothetical protein
MTDLRLREEGVSWRSVGDEVIAVDVQSSVYVSANTSGAVLWEALAAGTTRDALVDLLVERFGIERERAGADVDAFVAELRSRDLLA